MAGICIAADHALRPDGFAGRLPWDRAWFVLEALGGSRPAIHPTILLFRWSFHSESYRMSCGALSTESILRHAYSLAQADPSGAKLTKRKIIHAAELPSPPVPSPQSSTHRSPALGPRRHRPVEPPKHPTQGVERRREREQVNAAGTELAQIWATDTF